MGSNALSMTDAAAEPRSSTWDSETMDPNGDDRPAVRISAVGESSRDFPIPKINIFKLAIEVEDENFMARKAVCECLNIETYAEESAKVAKRRAAVASRKAKRCDSFAEAEHYRTTADKLSTAAKLTAMRAKNFDYSLRLVETDTKLAFQLAANTYGGLNKNEAKLIDHDAFQHLQRVKENTIRGTVSLKKDEYLVLKAMQRCWETYIPPSEGDTLQDGDADFTTPLIPRHQTDSGPTKWILMTRAVILGITGCSLLILNATMRIDGASSIVMLTAGAVCILWSLCYITSKITQKIIAKRKLAYIHRRTAMLKIIGKRLADLTHFFATEDVPIPSDEEEENPNMR